MMATETPREVARRLPLRVRQERWGGSIHAATAHIHAVREARKELRSTVAARGQGDAVRAALQRIVDADPTLQRAARREAGARWRWPVVVGPRTGRCCLAGKSYEKYTVRVRGVVVRTVYRPSTRHVLVSQAWVVGRVGVHTTLATVRSVRRRRVASSADYWRTVLAHDGVTPAARRRLRALARQLTAHRDWAVRCDVGDLRPVWARYRDYLPRPLRQAVEAAGLEAGILRQRRAAAREMTTPPPTQIRYAVWWRDPSGELRQIGHVLLQRAGWRHVLYGAPVAKAEALQRVWAQWRFDYARQAAQPDRSAPDTLGWRAWIVDRDGTLRSPVRGTRWETPELVAETWADGAAVSGACGIHALRMPVDLPWVDPHRTVAIPSGLDVVGGVVERYGRYVLGKEGWRAERVVIREIFADDPAVAARVAARYPGVPVSVRWQGPPRTEEFVLVRD